MWWKKERSIVRAFLLICPSKKIHKSIVSWVMVLSLSLSHTHTHILILSKTQSPAVLQCHNARPANAGDASRPAPGAESDAVDRGVDSRAIRPSSRAIHCAFVFFPRRRQCSRGSGFESRRRQSSKAPGADQRPSTKGGNAAVGGLADSISIVVRSPVDRLRILFKRLQGQMGDRFGGGQGVQTHGQSDASFDPRPGIVADAVSRARWDSRDSTAAATSSPERRLLHRRGGRSREHRDGADAERVVAGGDRLEWRWWHGGFGVWGADVGASSADRSRRGGRHGVSAF